MLLRETDWALHEESEQKLWYARGEESGIEKGIEKSIGMFILDYLEEGFTTERILEKLQKRFGLSEEQAKEYFDKYSNE